MRNPKMYGLALSVALSVNACNDRSDTGAASQPELNFEESLQLQLIEAQPGDTIEIPPGRHEMTRSLSLSVPGVTIRGAGMDRSILSFSGQLQGAEGLLVTADDFVIEDLAIEDTIGDALKINESTNVIIRRVRTEWTNGPDPENGAYGIYPVQSSHILIDSSVAIGAADAGIYVGQSSQIIVRNSRAEYNVAGIEIENSTFADVYDNVATNNTGGILAFITPGLPIKTTYDVIIRNNFVVSNNHPNFAAPGSTVTVRYVRSLAGSTTTIVASSSPRAPQAGSSPAVAASWTRLMPAASWCAPTRTRCRSVIPVWTSTTSRSTRGRIRTPA